MGIYEFSIENLRKILLEEMAFEQLPEGGQSCRQLEEERSREMEEKVKAP